MMQVKLTNEKRALKRPFVIARETIADIDILAVEITDGDYQGRGECVPQAVYDQSVKSCMRQIEKIRSRLEAGISRADLMKVLPAGSARNAVDCALWDLEAKQSGVSVWELAGLEAPEAPLAGDMTIGIGTPNEMNQWAREFAGFDILKVKLSNDRPVERIRAVHEGAPASRLMVDINEGWTLDELRTYAPQLKELGVELIEQPIPRGRDWGLIDFDSPVPLAADESCFDRNDLPFLEGRYQYINIKLEKSGGLTEALALVEDARRRGFGLMLGCMVSTSLSMAPGFVVASLCEYRDLDGASMLKEDRTPSVRIEDGLIYPFETALWG